MPTPPTDKTNFEQHITASSSNITALEHLAQNTPLSKQKIKQTMSNGAVWLESAIGIHRIRRGKKVIKENDLLHLYYDEAIQNTKPLAAELIADEGEYSVWNKPYGMYSQGSKWGDHCTIYRWAEEHLTPQRPAFIVHRLDRAASGLIIIAHSKKMAITFSELFKQRLIQKQYSAIVKGDLTKIELPLTIDGVIDDKPALSKILFIKSLNDGKTQVTIEIETGRKHQIRKHLASIGFPIIGDRLHGNEETDENLQLQANYLNFICPLTNTKKEYSL